jgi:superfamily II DNA helicase RecQ
MIDKGDGNREQKLQQRENLREVIKYSENKSDCRRKLVLRYFGEDFNESQCNRTCDNCERSTKSTKVDRTAYALKALTLAKDIDDRFTLNMLLDAFRGSAAKKSLKFQDCMNYGSGRDLPKTEAERILQEMVINQVLRTYNQTNPGGFTTSYIKLGAKYKDLENGKLRITLTVCEEEDNRTTTGSNSTTHQTKKATTWPKRKAPTIIDEDDEVDFLDKYDDDEYVDEEGYLSNEEEDSDFNCYEEEHESKIPSSPVYNATSFKENKSKSGVNSSSSTRKNDGNDKRDDFVSLSKLAPEYQSVLYRGEVSSIVKKGASESVVQPSGICYDRLIQWRDGIAQEKKLNAAFVLSNGVLGSLARQLPADEDELSGIPGMTQDKISKYGKDILSITHRYIL